MSDSAKPEEQAPTEQKPSEEEPQDSDAAAIKSEGEGEKPSTGNESETPPEAEPTTEAAAEAAAQEVEEEEEEPEEEEPDDGVPIVLVTGASGFVASHLIKQLLEQGRYHVRGTVRSKKKQEKVKPLRELVPDAKYPLRLVEADLSKADSWAKAVNRCTYVFHVASPFILNVSDEAAIIRTAVEGTTNVLQACADAGTVKRVVVTSSVAAISCGQNGDPEKPVDYVYTEKDWSPEAHCDPYEKSKLKAEQAAWDFVKNLDESKRFELAVVNPAYVQGPLLSAHSGEGSKEVCERILGGKIPALPDTSFPVVDVRDVAAAHIAAMEKSEATGNRYLLSNKLLHMREFADIIRNEFGPQGYKIASKNMPKPLVWVGKLFIPSLKGVYRSLGKTVEYNNEQMVNTLGIQPRPVEESLIDLCYSLVDLGIVKKTRGYLGHPSTRPTPPPPEEPANEGAAESTADQAKEDEPAETGTGEEAPQPAAEEEGEKGEDKPPADGQTEEAKPEGEAGSEEQPTS